MALTKEQISKLNQAKRLLGIHTFNRQQVEFILARELTDKVWHAYQTSESRKLKRTKDVVYTIKRLFKETTEKSKPKFTFSDVARHTAIKARKRELRKPVEDFRIASLFKSNKHGYKIEKIKEYKYSKFNTSRSEYKIFGDVDIFRVHNVITELINKMTTSLPDNAKLQISLENNKNDKVNQTKLLNKTDMIAKLADWVILFIDYHDMEIEDITIKLLKIEIPTGTGKRVNKIIKPNFQK